MNLSSAALTLFTAFSSTASAVDDPSPSIWEIDKNRNLRAGGNNNNMFRNEPPKKVDICHYDEEEGVWKKITISEKAVSSHMENHDDGMPGGTTSGGTLLDVDCVTQPPSSSPTGSPTQSPSSSPSQSPSTSPSQSPTASPSQSPTSSPTSSPSSSPTGSPTMEPSSSPTVGPSASPTKEPSSSPTVGPSTSPTKEATLELYFEANNVGQGIATSWLGQQTFCNNQGKRLCKLDELCQARGYYASPFTQAFTANLDIPAVVSGADNWIAYETNDDTRQDNCGVYGGCPLNAWIQIGNRAPVCNTHCELVTFENIPQFACPGWGSSPADQGFVPTVAVCCDDHE